MDHGQNAFTYKAFISYSHEDRIWAEWLQKAIEDFTVPRQLVGTAGRDGPLPKKLYPVFRDRDELPSSHDLNNRLRSHYNSLLI
jgi:hypothetical protein